MGEWIIDGNNVFGSRPDGWWNDRPAERATVKTYFDRLRVRATQESVTAALSGGNQQKIVMAKWLAAQCDVLILDEPTRGVDVGAKAEIHAWVDRLASEGAAVLLISSELPELIALSTRVLVLPPLDEASAGRVIELLLAAHRAGATVVAGTHDPRLVAAATVRYALAAGRLVS